MSDSAGAPSDLPPPSEESYFWTVRGIYNLEKIGDIKKAIEYFRKAISADSNNVAAKEYLFNALEKYGESSDDIKTDKGEYGASYQWYVNAEFLLEKDNLEEALLCLKQSLDLNPFNLQAARLFKEVRQKLKGGESVLDVSEDEPMIAVQAPTPDEIARNWYLSARYHQDKGNYQEAMSALEKALELVPDYQRAVDLLREIKGQEKVTITDQLETGESESGEGIEALSPDTVGTARHWFWLGRYYTEVKSDYRQALSCLEKAVILDPDDPQIKKALDETKLKVFFNRELTTALENESGADESGPVSVWDEPVEEEPMTEEAFPDDTFDLPPLEEEQGDMPVGEIPEEDPDRSIVFSPEELAAELEDIDISDIGENIRVIGDHAPKPIEELLEQVERSPEISFMHKKRELADITAFLFPGTEWRDRNPREEVREHPVLEYAGHLTRIMQSGRLLPKRRVIDENWTAERTLDVLGTSAKKKNEEQSGPTDLSFEMDREEIINGHPQEALALYKSHLFDILSRNPGNLRVLHRLYRVYSKEGHMEAAALVFYKTNQEIRRRVQKREPFDDEETKIKNTVDCLLSLFLVENAVSRYNSERDSWMSPVGFGKLDREKLVRAGYFPSDPNTMARLDLILGTREIVVSFPVGACACPENGTYQVNNEDEISCSVHGIFPRLPETMELPGAMEQEVMEVQ